MVSFYRDSPEYIYKEAKYVWYEQLFPDLEDQATRVLIQGSNGYGLEEELDELPNTPIPKNEFYMDYYVDGKLELSIHKAVLVLEGMGVTRSSYNHLDNPDHVRLSFDDACVMGLEEKIVRNADGTPNVEATPSYHCVKFIFNEMPADVTNYRLDLIGRDNAVIMTRNGVVELTTPPWEES